jgi:LytS/YehU family sensor histidine kinase
MLQERQWRERERQHAETELNFLKSQIHPHFFFNTLNNLYSLTIQKSDLAPEIVLKLSDLMSYMLYESGAPTVPLDKEIANLENYIAIERLRFGDRIALTFEKEGDTGLVQIPPLILLAFVENSFKHGLKNNIRSVRIDIRLQVQPGHIFFNISNPMEEEAAGEERNGIGLKNVTRRLDLLYGSLYTLDLTRTDDVFGVHLKIPVA